MSAQSRSLSDSFDFSSLPGDALGRRGAKWLEKVNKPSEGGGALSPPPPPPLPPPAPAPRSAAPKAASPVRRSSSSARRSATQPPQRVREGVGPDSSTSPHTPSLHYGRDGRHGAFSSSVYTSPNDRSATTGRFPSDLSAYGSPIPVHTDDSDGPIGAAFVSRLQQSQASYTYGSSGAVHRSPHSHPAATPSPEESPETSPYPEPQPFPFGNENSAVTAKPMLSSSSAYTSALIQALSLSEGAAMASTNQQSLSSMPLYNSPSGGGRGDSGYGHSESEEEGERTSSDDGVVGRGRGLYEHAMRVKVAKQQWISLEKARQEILENARLERDCPFQPRVSPYAAKIQRPLELRPENRAHGEMLRKRQWTTMKQQEEAERAMEGCTFRPLTLRAARLEKDGKPRTDSEVFSELYHEAEARKHFEDAVQPQVVDVMKRHVIHRGSSGPAMPPEEIQRVVERLFTQSAAVVAPGSGGATRTGPLAITVAIPEETFKPELSKATVKMMEEKRRKGERDPDVVNDLYDRLETAQLERKLEVALQEEEERQARQAATARREEAREKLEEERFRAVLAAKYGALARRAWGSDASGGKRAFHSKGPHSVVALARASLDVLTPDETEELLAAFENCGVERITEAEFVFLVMRHAMTARRDRGRVEKGVGEDKDGRAEGTTDAGASWRDSPLFTVPPPPPPSLAANTHQRSGGSTRSISAGRRDDQHTDPLALAPAPLPRVKREKADPAVLEHVRRKREEQMLAWREEARRRAELAELGDPNFKPLPRRLIPYECRPDVHVPIRTNRAARLREARAKGLPGAEDEQRAIEHEAGPPLALEDGRGPVAAQQPRRVSPGAEPATARSLFPRSTSATPSQAVPRPRAASRPKSTSYAGQLPAAAATALSTKATRAPPSPALSPAPKQGRSRPSRTVSSPQAAAALVKVPSPAPAAPTPQAAPASQRHAAPPRRPETDRVYRGVIAEHAALGGEEALMELGRELLLRQLQEYQKKQEV